MPDPKKRKKALRRALKLLVTLALLGLAALLIWIYLVPTITANAVTVYDDYTAETGDISTTKSFSATLSVKKSETFSADEECTVRDLYVSSGDEVKKGDQLILLSTGDLFTASFDGVVNEIRVKKGDWVWRNFTVVQICDLEHLEVSMDVDEYDVEKLSLGQSCTVRVISLGLDFDTVIAHINRVSQSSGSVAFYSVTCDLTVPENVLPGMQATVTLPSDAVTGVVTLDEAALSFDENREPYVLLKQADGTYQKQAVEVGLTDGMKAEITSGLTAGQTVYVEAGTENVQSGFSLDDLYQAIFGKKVVINAEQGSQGGQGFPGGNADGTGNNASGFGPMSSDGTGNGPVSTDGTGNGAADATGAATQTADTLAAAGVATPTVTQDASASGTDTAATAEASDTAATNAAMGAPPSGTGPQGPGGPPSQATDGTVADSTAAKTQADATPTPAPATN